ncbi:unnamed protein product [Ectocarpus sp. CCAP 1310/34]|nr:unnamed protein product [Ectocarpus sp. CCAP 1310/34]
MLVVSKMRGRARVRAGARLRPPAPAVVGGDNAADGAPANLAEPAPIAPVLADDKVDGGGERDLAARASGAPVLADDDAVGPPANLLAPEPDPPTPPTPSTPPAQGAGNIPGAVAGEAKVGAEVEPSSISGSSATAASTPAAIPPLCPRRRPPPPGPRRSISLPDRLIPTPAAVTGDFASLARANTIGHHLPFVTAGIIDGGNGRGP